MAQSDEHPGLEGEQAEQIRAGVCSCPNVYLMLHDADGEQIAFCCLSPDEWRQLSAKAANG